jgi:hypothetical protein
MQLPLSQQQANCPILSNINPIQDLPSYLLKIRLNIIFSTSPGIQKDLVHSDFHIKTLY